MVMVEARNSVTMIMIVLNIDISILVILTTIDHCLRILAVGGSPMWAPRLQSYMPGAWGKTCFVDGKKRLAAFRWQFGMQSLCGYRVTFHSGALNPKPLNPQTIDPN